MGRRDRRREIREGEWEGEILHTRVMRGPRNLVGNEWRDGYATPR